MKYIILLVLGIIIGGGAAIYFLGVPSAKRIPGTAVQAPPPGGDPPGTVVVSISNSFFNELLGTVFRDLSPPSFKLASQPAQDAGIFTQAAFQGGCTNSITLAAEGSNVKTQVQFVNGKLSAPLAFSATYNAGGCSQFKGWAQTTMQLSFDQPSQTLYGRLVVDGVELEGFNPVVNPIVTVFVRTAIDSKINPIQLLRPQQLQLLIPVQSSNGSVKATVKDVRSEVQDNQLRLHITYDFSGSKGQPPAG
jgi:hypothetical protein